MPRGCRLAAIEKGYFKDRRPRRRAHKFEGAQQVMEASFRPRDGARTARSANRAVGENRVAGNASDHRYQSEQPLIMLRWGGGGGGGEMTRRQGRAVQAIFPFGELKGQRVGSRTRDQRHTVQDRAGTKAGTDADGHELRSAPASGSIRGEPVDAVVHARTDRNRGTAQLVVIRAFGGGVISEYILGRPERAGAVVRRVGLADERRSSGIRKFQPEVHPRLAPEGGARRKHDGEATPLPKGTGSRAR